MIVVEVKNEILGNSEFWRGPEDRIAEIRNVPARMTAQQVVKDGKPRACGMWHVRQEVTPNAAAQPTATRSVDGRMQRLVGRDGGDQT